EEGRDGVRDGVRVQIVVQRVVAVAGIQADFEVVVRATGLGQHGPNLTAEISFHLHDQAADLPLWIVSAPTQELVDVWIHAGGRLAGSDRAKNRDTGVEPALRDCQPVRVVRAAWCVQEMRFTEDHGWRRSTLRKWVLGE